MKFTKISSGAGSFGNWYEALGERAGYVIKGKARVGYIVLRTREDSPFGESLFCAGTLASAKRMVAVYDAEPEPTGAAAFDHLFPAVARTAR